MGLVGVAATSGLIVWPLIGRLLRFTRNSMGFIALPDAGHLAPISRCFHKRIT
jgi:hypothetical protein